VDQEQETTSSDELTQLLHRWSSGDLGAAEQVVDHAYQELHAIASRHLQGERIEHTLGPTALVHEVYFRLIGEQMPVFTSQGHFLGISARLMRQILVNHAVARKAAKRGGSWKRVPVEIAIEQLEKQRIDMLALNDSLNDLELREPMMARVVELRFFVGLSIDETAEALGVSPRKVVSSWTFARAWLMKEIRS